MVGRWCVDHHLHPKAIITGPLRRTRETAEIIQPYTSGELIVSEEMREIDYGLWEGLSSAEIESRYGASALKAWDATAAWPSDAGWPQQEATVTRAILDLMSGLERFGRDADVVLCTSNGILKTLSKHLIFAERPPTLGVRTGHLCIVENQGRGAESPSTVKRESELSSSFSPLPPGEGQGKGHRERKWRVVAWNLAP